VKRSTIECLRTDRAAWLQKITCCSRGALPPRVSVPARRQSGLVTGKARSGMALIVTLGILAVIAMAVVALVVTMRIERLAARNVLERTAARQYVDVGLAQAMSYVDIGLYGRTYPICDWLATNAASASAPLVCYRMLDAIPIEPSFHLGFTNCVNPFQNGDCMGTPSTNMSETMRLFRGSVTNFVPAALAGQATNIFSGWSTIIETNGQSGASAATDGYTAGRVSFLVINLSGLLDAHFLTKTREQALGDATLFATARKLIDASTTTATRVFLSQLDLTAANNGNQVSNLVTLSYDPGPDVYFAPSNQAVWFGTRPFATNLATRFNINALTNAQGFAQSIATVSNLLADAGIPEPDHAAYNILNYVDTGRLPRVAPGDQAYRTDYGVKDVPLINEVALEQSATSLEYRVKVELWYPFVPRDSPAATLQVCVYTDAPPDVGAASIRSSDLSYSADITPMTYHATNEFVVAGMSNAISFMEPDPQDSSLPWHPVAIGTGTPIHQVWIWPRAGHRKHRHELDHTWQHPVRRSASQQHTGNGTFLRRS